MTQSKHWRGTQSSVTDMRIVLNHGQYAGGTIMEHLRNQIMAFNDKCCGNNLNTQYVKIELEELKGTILRSVLLSC